MKVYIVIKGWDCEGYDIIGVFDTKDKATEFFKSYKLSSSADYFDIYEWEVK